MREQRLVRNVTQVTFTDACPFKAASEFLSHLSQNQDFKWEDNDSLRTFSNFYGAI